MRAEDVLKLLAKRHEQDLFVPECKSGKTLGAHYVRLDAFAMRRSWEHPMTFGYEIKISRADYLHDQKWTEYLPLVQSFYFVCPATLIQPDELPPDAGLIWISQVGARLLTKKKAPPRNIEPPLDLYRYILMCRSKIISESPDESSTEYWQKWLAERKAGHLGAKVSKTIADEVHRTHVRNSDLELENKALRIFRDKLVELGIDVRGPVQEWHVRGAMQKLASEIPRQIDGQLDRTIKDLQSVQRLIENIRKEGSK